MKIQSNLKNTKADRALKLANLTNAHQRRVRHNGHVYLVRVAKVGSLVIADAEKVGVKEPLINLFDQTPLAKDLKKLCENRLYS
jgi:hypothetical protein